jgi:hypothetical protein
MKENYENMDLLLKAVKYSKYGWKTCGDIKVIRLLPGMQSATQCCAVFFVNETAESMTNITQLRIGLYEKIQFQGKSML